MDTFVALSEGRRRRRIHSAEFKAHIVAKLELLTLLTVCERLARILRPKDE